MKKLHSYWRRITYGPAVEAMALPFHKVLRRELAVVEQKRRRLQGEAAPRPPESETGPEAGETPTRQDEELRDYESALRANLMGLAFSGGGIRSATFNLGVLQALADRGLLRRLDYLSTVSGGGYIGSWFTALLHRQDGARAAGDAEAILKVEERLKTRRDPRSRRPQSRKLGGRPDVERLEVEDPAIGFLRQFSNYLTPKVGFFTADTWTVITTYLRNLILNLVLLIASLAALLLAPRFVRSLSQLVPQQAGVEVFLALALLFAVPSVVVIGINMASFSKRARRLIGRSRLRRLLRQDRIQLMAVAPLLVGALFGTWWMWQLGRHSVDGKWELAPILSWWPLWIFFGAVAYAGSWANAWLLTRFLLVRVPQPEVGWKKLLAWSIPTGAVGGAVLMLIAWFVAGKSDWEVWRALAWGPPMILTWYFLLGALQTGFIGRDFHDHQREWLSRLGAWLLIYAVGWAGLFLVSVYGPVLLYTAGGWVRAGLASGWLAATAWGLIAGRSPETDGQKSSGLKDLAVGVAPYLFILGLLVGITVGIDWVTSRPADKTKWWDNFQAVAEYVRNPPVIEQEDAQVQATGAAGRIRISLIKEHLIFLERTYDLRLFAMLFAGLLAVAALMGWRVDVNEFSMHRFYRNRLVRCYLGASVHPETRSRRRQPFTGFYPDDDIILHKLGPEGPQGVYPGPLHLVNTALNLVGGDDLAWQQRKAASFTFSPLYCGYETQGGSSLADIEPDAFRSAAGYGGHPKKLTLGTAMAISGAAASPNMGHHTSPALSFLLAVFNVRLGWWLGNPRHIDAWTRSGPSFGPWHLVREVLGYTRDDTEYVYLSDGGHFENLGLYELVRRRCRFIIACDTGADPELKFEDLGNAIRKCRADLGIEIDLKPLLIRERGEDHRSRWHCAVGRIYYDRIHTGWDNGILLYLKPSLTGDESEDVLNYAQENPEFPHETTADQWFDEGQFESYRMLGHHIASTALRRAARAAMKENVENLFVHLKQDWYPPSGAVAASFTRHTETLDELFHRARKDGVLAFLDQQFYPEWESLMEDRPRAPQRLTMPLGERERRQGFYFCNSLIQLMENVYLDLDLENEYFHPDNRGWMNLFRHWSWSGMFKATWAICASTYGSRFQSFCEEQLGLELGELQAKEILIDLTGDLTEETEEEKVDGAKELSNRILNRGQRDWLNFHEKQVIWDFLKKNRDIDHIVSLQLAIQTTAGGKSADELSFGCGFAMISGQELLFFRIQDHLRRIGLARKSLRQLIGGDLKVRKFRMANVPPAYHAEFRRGVSRFIDLFYSVRREVDLERKRIEAAERQQKEMST